MKTLNFFLTGVGGQGTLMASNVLAQVGLEAGFDVKKAEVHGMAQRGGSVSSQIRWGDRVHSPLIGQGEADFLIAFEKLEALRYICTGMLKPGGTVLVGEMAIAPLSVSSGDDAYPDDEQVEHVIGAITEDVHYIPSLSLARQAGNVRAHNVVALGALSTLLPQVPEAIWLDVVAQRVPEKYIAVNQQAFQLGKHSLTR